VSAERGHGSKSRVHFLGYSLETHGRKQWNKQAATSSFLDKKLPKSLEQQGLEGSTAVGKDEVGSSNLPSSSIESLETAMVSRLFLFLR
jgi:hypothetical protein